MPAVTVVTDSTHYLPAEVLAAHDVRQVSLYVNEGDRTERDSTISFDDFYARLATTDDLPTTSQPSIGDFLEVYDPLLDAGQDIVSVHLSGGISGTVESARQAAEDALRRHPDRRVEVVDSHSAAGGHGLIMLAGANAASAGASADEVVARMNDIQPHMKNWFAVDTLEFLRRGGRIGTAQAWLGGALKIKPILEISDEIHPIERVRTSGRAFERMVAFAQERKGLGATAWAVQHIRAPDRADQLVQRATEIFGHGPEFVSEIGPVLGTHVGPGLLGFASVPPDLLR